MQAQNCQTGNDMSFREFLSSCRTGILIILVLSLAFRVVLAVRFPLFPDDQVRYTVPAVNMLAGHGFSSAVREPYKPSQHTVPLYPLFIAGVYAVFRKHNS